VTRAPVRAEPAEPQAASDPQVGIDSVETGVRLLMALARLGGRPQMLSTLAAHAGMPPPKAHRYLVSFVRTGLVERDPAMGRYRLGPAAVELGAAALGSVDAVALAAEAMPALRDEVDQTVALMVWGTLGPVIVRAEESERVVSVSFRIGRSLPVLASASGMSLAAHLPWATVAPAIAHELERGGSGDETADPRALEAVRRRLATVRRRGMSRIDGTVTAGITALAVPVLDVTGRAVASMSVVGPGGSFDAGWDGPVARALARTCAALSARIGGRSAPLAA
jgi:DNA-binding IclR family transcriptional regulator